MLTEFKKNYKISTNFLCYIGLCNAIPKHWKKAFSRDNENDLVVTGGKHAHFMYLNHFPKTNIRSSSY